MPACVCAICALSVSFSQCACIGEDAAAAVVALCFDFSRLSARCCLFLSVFLDLSSNAYVRPLFQWVCVCVCGCVRGLHVYVHQQLGAALTSQSQQFFAPKPNQKGRGQFGWRCSCDVAAEFFCAFRARPAATFIRIHVSKYPHPHHPTPSALASAAEGLASLIINALQRRRHRHRQRLWLWLWLCDSGARHRQQFLPGHCNRKLLNAKQVAALFSAPRVLAVSLSWPVLNRTEPCCQDQAAAGSRQQARHISRQCKAGRQAVGRQVATSRRLLRICINQTQRQQQKQLATPRKNSTTEKYRKTKEKQTNKQKQKRETSKQRNDRRTKKSAK